MKTIIGYTLSFVATVFLGVMIFLNPRDTVESERSVAQEGAQQFKKTDPESLRKYGETD